MLLHRPPTRALAQLVERLWHSDGRAEAGAERAPRERALPTGRMDLVFRIAGEPIRVFADLDERVGTAFGHAVVCGARSVFHVRDTSRPSSAVGVHFLPGGAEALLGVPSGELAGRHTALEELWGRDAERARAHLCEAASPAERLAVLEQLLLARLSERWALHPAVAHALARLEGGGGAVREICRETGYSQRRLIELFQRSVGLTPKLYGRIRRFQRALERAARGRARGWAQVALECGFYDQPHLNREFRAFAGLAPGAYEPVPDRPNHVPERGAPPGSAGSIPSKPPGPESG